MNKIRSLGLVAAAGAVAVLTGCAAGPGYYGDPGYQGYSGYSTPYYDPVVVTPPPVYIQGGGYYGGRPGYREPYYDRRGRGDYPGVRPGYLPRPGVVPPRAVQAQPIQRTPPGYPRQIVVPPQVRGGPGAVVQPSWNNKEQP